MTSLNQRLQLPAEPIFVCWFRVALCNLFSAVTWSLGGLGMDEVAMQQVFYLSLCSRRVETYSFTLSAQNVLIYRHKQLEYSYLCLDSSVRVR